MSGPWRALGTALSLVGVVAGAGPARAAFTTFETGEVRPLATSPDGSHLFVANTPDARLEIFTIGAGGLTHVGALPVGLEPCTVSERTHSEVRVGILLLVSVMI